VGTRAQFASYLSRFLPFRFKVSFTAQFLFPSLDRRNTVSPDNSVHLTGALRYSSSPLRERPTSPSLYSILSSQTLEGYERDPSLFLSHLHESSNRENPTRLCAKTPSARPIADTDPGLPLPVLKGPTLPNALHWDEPLRSDALSDSIPISLTCQHFLSSPISLP